MAASLDASLSSDVPPSLRDAIVESFWGAGSLPKHLFNGESGSQISLEIYFGYFGNQCRMIALHEGGRYASVRKYQHLVDIVQSLKKPLARDAIGKLMPDLVETQQADGDQHRASVNLAARLLLMIEFGNLSYGFSGRKGLIWEDGTLREFVDNYFCVPPALGHERVKLEKTFNARNIGLIAGIEIEWTSNLVDHLRMMGDDKKVAIFHHASFLEYQGNSILPAGLVNETFRTLALLFPQSDSETQEWLRKLLRTHALDPRIAKCGSLRADDRQIENFTFWHDRLVILKQVFDEARPNTLSQWWWDRRNGVQWYTFWVAVFVLVLTIVFGVVQCVEGALQVYKAYHPTSAPS